jgi:chorismate dehydratase
MKMAKITLAAVPYLNAAPLALPLEGMTGVEVIYAKPSEMPGLLRSCKADAATLPIGAYLADERLEIVSDAAIASSGPVRSVAIYSKIPLENARTVALDAASITSRSLARIICEKFIRMKPKYTDAPNAKADAELVIGDNGLRREKSGEIICDLGNIWTLRTGLPFVYAAWIMPAQKTNRDVAEMFREARDKGAADLENISRISAERSGFEPDFVLQYLKNNIHYTLGARELEGIARFQDYLLEIGIIKRRRKIEIRGCGHS